MTAAQRIRDIKEAVQFCFNHGHMPEFYEYPFHNEDVLQVHVDRFNGYWFQAARSGTIFAIATPEKQTLHLKKHSTYRPLLKELATVRGWRVIDVEEFTLPNRLQSGEYHAYATQQLTEAWQRAHQMTTERQDQRNANVVERLQAASQENSGVVYTIGMDSAYDVWDEQEAFATRTTDSALEDLPF